MRHSFYTMKERLDGMKSSPRDKLIWKYYPCPGCKPHQIRSPRKEVLFNHYVERPQKSYITYWRSHPEEYSTMMKFLQS